MKYFLSWAMLLFALSMHRQPLSSKEFSNPKTYKVLVVSVLKEGSDIGAMHHETKRKGLVCND